MHNLFYFTMKFLKTFEWLASTEAEVAAKGLSAIVGLTKDAAARTRLEEAGVCPGMCCCVCKGNVLLRCVHVFSLS